MARHEVVALLSDDLMFRSRLQAALGPEGIAVAAARSDEMLPAADLVFVDLNRDFEARLEAIGRIRGGRAEVTVVGFCDHAEKVLLRRAMLAGASQVVANRHLAEAARRLSGASDVAELGSTDAG